jgi:hypothetical protein
LDKFHKEEMFANPDQQVKDAHLELETKVRT